MEDYKEILDKLTSLETKIEDVNKNVEVKPVFAGSTDTNAVDEKEGISKKMNKALRDVVSGKINRITIDKAVNVEGTDNIGGYLVPLEYGDELIGTINQYGFARQNATIKKLTRDKMQFPTVSTDIVAYAVAEGNQITASNYVFGAVTLDTQKYATLVPMSSELIQDNAYDLQNEVIKSSAIGFANKEDILAIKALTGATLAVSSVVGTAVSTCLTGQYGYGKLVDAVATLEASNTNYLNGAKWIMSPQIKAQVRKIVDSNGQPIMQTAQGLQPDTLLGYPVITTNLMPNASITGQSTANSNQGSGSGNSTAWAYFGNPQNLYFGDRQSMDIYVGREGVVGSDNMFEKDLIAYRCIERVDIKLARPDAFVKCMVSGA